MNSSTSSEKERKTKKKRKRGAGDVDEEGTSVGLFGRRVWNKELFEKRAKQRLEQEKHGIDTDAKRKTPIHMVPLSERKPLTARASEEIDLQSIVGQRTRITVETDPTGTVVSSAQGGYYCKLCQVAIKDSNTYLDHVNSQRHLNASGTTSRAVKSTVTDVRRRLRQPPKKPSEARRVTTTMAATAATVYPRRAEEEKKGAETGASPLESASASSTPSPSSTKDKDANGDGEMMRALGFAGFTTSKK